MAAIKHCDSCGSYVGNGVVIPLSPTPHLRRTHSAPTASERASIAKLLIDAQETVSQFNVNILDIQMKLIGLLEKRNAMLDVIACHGSLLSPIRRLPEEILSYIFFLCLPVSREEASLSTARAPLLLTQVCVAWRNCAWSSQRLWSSFTISSKVTTHRSLLDHWLSHTTSSPLSIIIKDSIRHRASPAWPSISRTIQYCDRWQELIVHMPTSTLSRFGSVKHRLRSLEKLSFKLIHDHIQPIDIFEFAPRLRCVELETSVHTSRLRLPWHQLDTLEIRVGRMGHLFSILQLSTNLRNLVLDSSSLDTTALNHLPGLTVTLPHLISLRLSMPCDIRILCKSMRCPALKSLDILTSAESLMSDEFSGFLASSSSLDQLSLHYLKISQPVDLLPCLAAAPTVSILELNVASPAMSLATPPEMYPGTAASLRCVMDRMTDYPGSGGRILLPALEELSVTKSPLDGRLFANMIHSRNGNAIGGQSVAVLKRVNLSDPFASFDLSKEELRSFFGVIDNGASKLRVSPYMQERLNEDRLECGLPELAIDGWT